MIVVLAIGFWAGLALKIGIMAAIVPVVALPIIFAELKLSAHMQHRIGPYFAGGRYGWAQPLADGLKFFQKEDLVPDAADKMVYKLAPYLVLGAAMAVFVVIPFGPDLIGRDLDLGIFYALAISSISTIGVLIAGWSSGNKYSLIGGLRAAAQLIAYELPLFLAVVGVVIQAQTMSMIGIIDAQAEYQLFGLEIAGNAIAIPYVFPQFIGFVIFYIAALAELSRTPFDMPIAESELVMGYLTEYSGFRFAVFFIGEYIGIFTMSAIMATLWLGGYDPLFFDLSGLNDIAANAIGALVLFGKVAILVFLMIWMRWTFPRFREDQLQDLAWRILIPLGLANIAVTAFFKVVF
ncbi:MAG: NADH-quinone oxidoreductase subunit NuoH [Acidimicrobiia bacterium]|nr:NADH-quinone oxidoreductase subunit NuoH [Acidimicrobiia bacterium]